MRHTKSKYRIILLVVDDDDSCSHFLSLKNLAPKVLFSLWLHCIEVSMKIVYLNEIECPFRFQAEDIDKKKMEDG